jgi:glycosyltransferase involved in cell wall biosynthesis
VVPCYNYGHLLGACLESVLSQPDVAVRVLVIDDASTDDSAEVARALAAGDDRVHVSVHPQNRGHIATYNEGLLDWAEADYCVLLSADDLLTPGALGRATQLMEARPSVGMVYGRSVYFEHHDRLPRHPTRYRGARVWSGRDWIEGRCRTGYNVISSPEVVARTEVQRRVGGYRPELPHAGDFEMWLRFAAVSDIAYVQGVPQALYRVHQASMQRSTYRGVLIDLEQRRDVFDAFFERHGPEVAGADGLHDLARRALARQALWEVCRSYDRDDLEVTPVDELLAFAGGVWPDLDDLPEHAMLRRRQRLGPAVCHRTQLFAGTAAWRRVQRRTRLERWKRQGV